MQPRAKIVIVLLILIGVVVWFATRSGTPVQDEQVQQPTVNVIASSTVVIGKSVEGRSIEVYTFGSGDKHLLFVGGIHGGYEWNSVLLAYQAIEYIKLNPDTIPVDLTVSIIPSLNPDGVFDVIGKEGKFALTDVPADEGVAGNGRFNANGVDLNRNFDCKWQPESTWRSTVVSAGTNAFSEPEAIALRDYVLQFKPVSVVFWHSQANAVYASECTEGILPETIVAMDTYATVSGYTAIDTFDAYPVTGDAEGWLASIGIPAITVELATHTSVEWERNLAGINALFSLYSITR